MKLEILLQDAKTVAIPCNQWGDTGKGKFVDLFAELFDIVIRCTGGANAGHTVKVQDQEVILHLIPSGILHDKKGVVNIIGNGVVLDPVEVMQEMAAIHKAGYGLDHLMISHNAHLVLPQHILLDRLGESVAGKGKIGTTGRGIGYAYQDIVARTALTVNDLLNKDTLRKKLERNLETPRRILQTHDPEIVRSILHNPKVAAFSQGLFYHPTEGINLDALVEVYSQYGNLLREHVFDTQAYVREQVGKKRILLEGAQGALLSIDYGTYPFVTSSDCSIEGMAKGAGIDRRQVDLVLGIVKAFYMTRVGEGPFPTELGGSMSAEHCNTATREQEARDYADVSINDQNPLRRGIAVRRAGHEYGATTRRARRTGDLDLPLLRYAAQINDPDIALTKVDVLTGADTIQICNQYRYDGPTYYLGERTLNKGDILTVAVPNAEVLQYCTPIYQQFPGWKEDITQIKTYEELPGSVRSIVKFIEHSANVRVRMISVGPERTQTIVRA